MKDGLKDRIFKVFTITLVIGILVIGLIVSWPDFLRQRAMMQQDAEISRLIEEKKAEIETLKTKQNRFRTDRDFVEAIARQNNRVFPGELVFIFEEE